MMNVQLLLFRKERVRKKIPLPKERMTIDYLSDVFFMRRKMCRILFDPTKSCRRGFVWRARIGIGEGVNRLFFAARDGFASLDT